MNTAQQCPVCRTPASITAGSPTQSIDCPRCGQYQQQKPWVDVIDTPQQIRLSGWIREQNSTKSVPLISADVVKRISFLKVPDLRSRARAVLKLLVRDFGRAKQPISEIHVETPEYLGVSYSVDDREISRLMELLAYESLIDRKQSFFRVNIAGLLAAEEISASNATSAQGFIAMDFSQGMNDAWSNGFDPAIRSAGFKPMRIDNKDYIGGITDEIIAEIRQSRFVVADYTGQRSGVYFEAGFALGLGITVIPTCRNDEIGGLHFDIRHLNTLGWSSPADLADKLSKRIKAVIGQGPH